MANYAFPLYTFAGQNVDKKTVEIRIKQLTEIMAFTP